MMDYDIVMAAIVEQARKIQQEEAERAVKKPKKRFG